jgi:hypothetical protein
MALATMAPLALVFDMMAPSEMEILIGNVF